MTADGVRAADTALRSTNALERINRELRRKLREVGAIKGEHDVTRLTVGVARFVNDEMKGLPIDGFRPDARIGKCPRPRRDNGCERLRAPARGDNLRFMLPLFAEPLLSILLLAAPASVGCSKDTDCKGTRVCEQGQCVKDPGIEAPKTSPKAALKSMPVQKSQPKPSKDGMVFLTIESNEPTAMLMRIGKSKEGLSVARSFLRTEVVTSASTEHSQACAPPCQLWLNRHEEYYVKNVSLAGGRSGTLVLPDRERVTLYVESHSIGARKFGAVMALLGVSTVLTGLIFWGLAPAGNKFNDVGKNTFFVGLPITAMGFALDLANTAEVRLLPPDSGHD